MATAAAASLRQVVTSHCVASTSAAAAAAATSSTRVQVCARGFSLRLCAPRVTASRSLSLSLVGRKSGWKASTRRTVVRCSADASGAATAELDPALLDKVIDVISEKSGVEKNLIKPDSGFEELNIDSLDQVEIMMSLEDEYGIALDEQNAAKLSSVMDVAKFIAEEMKNPKSK